MMQHLLVFLSITISPKDRRVNKCKKKAPQEDSPRTDSLKAAFKPSATELSPAVNTYRLWTHRWKRLSPGGSENKDSFLKAMVFLVLREPEVLPVMLMTQKTYIRGKNGL